MLRGSPFAKAVFENEISLKIVLQHIYHTAQTILENHPLSDYFEKYIGGVLIVMDPNGNILSPDDSDMLTLPQSIGYVHPLDRDNIYEEAVINAKKLLNKDLISSFEDKSKDAGAIKIKEGIIFSYSGFEFLELKEKSASDDYKDIFETINLYTLLSHGFFDTNKQVKVNPYPFNDYDSDEEEKYNRFREEIIYSLSNEELIEIATRIIDKEKRFNFGLLNEIFISKVLLETGFIDQDYAKEVIKISNNRFASAGTF